MNKLTLLKIFVIPFSFLILASCSKKDEGTQKVVVRLKWLHQAQFAGFYVADQKGFYKSENLDVQLNPGGVDFPAIQMVVGGSEQFGVAGADQLILAREKGAQVVALAVIYRVSPFVLFSLKESKITKLEDFINKKIGVKLGGNEELTYRAMMRNAMIPFEKVKEIPIKYDMSPLFTKQVDVWPGYVINEPIIAEEKGFPVNIIWPKDYNVVLYADAIFTTEKILNENPDLVKRFIRASLKGWKYATEHSEEAVKYTLLYDKNLNYEHESKMMKTSIDLIKPDNSPIGWMENNKWEEMQRLLLEQNILKNKIEINKVYTTKFIDYKGE